MYINNNGGIMNNNYGRIEGLISLFRISMDKRKYFFKFYSHFRQGPLQSFGSLALEALYRFLTARLCRTFCPSGCPYFWTQI